MRKIREVPRLYHAAGMSVRAIARSVKVATYVQEEMNRVEHFATEGDDRLRLNAGFALAILQRRLASSPAAIHEALRRRRGRLETRLAEKRLLKRGR